MLTELRRFAPLLLLLAITTITTNARAETKDAELSFGIVPQQAAAQLAALWSPIFKYLSERTGVDMGFRTAPDIPTFEQRLAAGQYDLAYMNPYHYTVFHEHPGYVAFAHQRDKRIRGILVTRADAGIAGIEDLRGATLAFPAPAAFAASVLPRAALREAGIDIEPRYVRSHDSVYRAVAQGLYPAGGGIERTFDNADSSVRDQLRVLWRTEDYTPHAFAAHPRVDKQTVARVRDAMVAMADDPRGQQLLAAIGFVGIDPASDGDWNDVRALNIDLLESAPAPAPDE
jgi:phosphonate transport system substrate-binding protein